jgi:hypothetical protein
MGLSSKQVQMLLDFANDGEATDICDFDYNGPSLALAWRNRERVIDSLRTKGLLNDDGITEAGKIAIGRE